MSEKKTRIIAAVYMAAMMLLLGMSDALRGVFLPVLRETFSLSQAQGSALIMLSYVGNLLFLIAGGWLVGRMPRKRFLCMMMLLWMAALAAYWLTQNAAVLYIGILFSMGASTMLSTTINLTTPLLFASPALLVNLFYFSQGVGIFAAQNLGGRIADRYVSWQHMNLLLLSCGSVCLLLMLFCIRFPAQRSETKAPARPLKVVFSHPAAKWLLLCFGLYSIAEHGLQNWMVTYGSDHLGYTREQSAKFLSYFFLGITFGRLVLAPVVQKLGLMRSLLLGVTGGGVLYIGGILLGRDGIVLLCASGLLFSFLWPMTMLLTAEYYPAEYKGAATSWITGLANLFDIAFNACFGAVVQGVGFGKAILVLPAAMALYVLCMFVLRFHIGAPAQNAENT